MVHRTAHSQKKWATPQVLNAGDASRDALGMVVAPLPDSFRSCRYPRDNVDRVPFDLRMFHNRCGHVPRQRVSIRALARKHHVSDCTLVGIRSNATVETNWDGQRRRDPKCRNAAVAGRAITRTTARTGHG